MSDLTPTDEAELRVWAEAHAPVGSVQARQVLALLDRLAEDRRQFSAGMLWSAEQIERYAGCVRSNMEAHGEAAEFGGVVPALEELAQMIRNSASGVRQVLIVPDRLAEDRRQVRASAALSKPGDWSKQKPTKTGYYWWRDTAGKVKPRIVRVHREPGGAKHELRVDAGTYWGPLAFWNGEWGGKVADEP